ncbi:MAG: sigma-70 family RNA polymerase sigma factor [Chloroflexi bacterium]|nr:sigma-70 family RNA polymerase sigma factor [Chloroflexota bacterium]
MNSSSVYFGVERRIHNSPGYMGRERRAMPWNPVRAGDEPTLIQYAIARNREAFARLYDRHVDKVFKYIYYLVGTKREAEELTGQVFGKAWQTIGDFRWAEQSFVAWLCGIARQAVTAHAPQAHDAPIGDEISASGLTADVLKRALARLAPDERQVVVLRFVEGFSVQQTAEVMGKSRKDVQTYQHRALTELGAIMSESPRQE